MLILENSNTCMGIANYRYKVKSRDLVVKILISFMKGLKHNIPLECCFMNEKSIKQAHIQLMMLELNVIKR